MKAVLVEVPAALVEERRRTGADRWDELWEGELHMVPPPSGLHQRLGMKLAMVLNPLAEARGLVGAYEAGLYRPGTDLDYRVPDHVYAHPGLATERGVDGPADVVVELASPGDETYDKLVFYAALGVGEVIVVHPAHLTSQHGQPVTATAGAPRRRPLGTVGRRGDPARSLGRHTGA